MKNKEFYLKSIFIMLFFSPTLLWATSAVQTPPKSDEFYQKAVDFLQGKGVIEDWFSQSFMPLFNTFMVSEYGSMIILGQAIAGAGTLLYLSYIGWQMLAGDKQWEIMPILKPFATAFVLMNWLAFTNIIKKPCDMLRDGAVAAFQSEQDQVSALRWKRFKYVNMMIDRIYEQQGDALAKKEQQEQANQSMLEDIADTVLSAGDSLLAPVYELTARLQVQVSLALSALLETICLWVLRVAVYAIIFVSLLFATFLIITGPISIGISVIPIFATSFSTWVARFININLYGFVAFTTLRLGMILIKFGYTAEIERYSKILADDGSISNTGMFMQVMQSNQFNLGLVAVTMLVTAVGVFMTPTLCNYIISANGISSGMSGSKRAGGMVTKAVAAVATKGASLLKK
ncbi:hypothetical protein NZD88_20755 [Chryseobacterium antibioticum]|uniref:Conjugative transposon TraJ C-terminal domain-containing protein n=1 Tax=Chryseobacterium pyrolae TaxID=2987481 RepID=A0ABT2IMU1_9FLAO|nr:hypothetical protein [Chryseobacterium pyrolae]MCT2409993.1 hypothetical protein [Chryseobacterium pyrolae]